MMLNLATSLVLISKECGLKESCRSRITPRYLYWFTCSSCLGPSEKGGRCLVDLVLNVMILVLVSENTNPRFAESVNLLSAFWRALWGSMPPPDHLHKLEHPQRLVA